MESGYSIWPKAVGLAAVVGLSLVKNAYDENKFQTQVSLESASDPEPIHSDLATVQEEIHEEAVLISTPLTVNNTEGFLDGACHLKDPEVGAFLTSLKILDGKLLDEYIRTQLLVCNGK